MEKNYYYLLMSQLDFFENEGLEECLREKSNSSFLEKKSRDFWIAVAPKFIEKDEIFLRIKETNFYQQKKDLISSTLFLSSKNTFEFYAAIISPNLNFIQWLNLRLGYFENLESFKKIKKLAFNPNYVSNGIFGKINFDLKKNYDERALIFNSNSKFIHPLIYVKKQKKVLESYYSKL